jgi:RNA polymerase sigma-70 factor (ECF subfamily)
MDGYSHQEIAEMTNISIGTSKSNLSRAKLILKNKIENYKTSMNTNFPSIK